MFKTSWHSQRFSQTHQCGTHSTAPPSVAGELWAAVFLHLRVTTFTWGVLAHLGCACTSPSGLLNSCSVLHFLLQLASWRYSLAVHIVEVCTDLSSGSPSGVPFIFIPPVSFCCAGKTTKKPRDPSDPALSHLPSLSVQENVFDFLLL